jgi:hypothetical protein
MRKIKLTLAIWIAALGICSVTIAQSMAFLSDTDRVQLAIDQIRAAVRYCTTEKLMEIVGQEMQIGSDTLSNIEVSILADSVFAEAESRKADALMPAGLPYGALWDFEIKVDSVEFSGDSCTVVCALKLYASTDTRGEICSAALQDSGSSTDTLVFTKPEYVWLLSSCGNLFTFLGSGGEK